MPVPAVARYVADMLLLLVLACDDTPTLRVVSPDEGARVPAGLPVTLEVGITPAAVLGDVQLEFAAGDAALTGELTLDSAVGEAAFVTSGLPVGDFVFTVRSVVDDGDAISASRAFVGFVNQAPTAAFFTPADGGAVIAGVPFEVRAQLGDADDVDGVEELALAWTGVAEGAASSPSSLLGPGEVHFLVEAVAVGEYTVGVTVTDRWGATGTTTSSFVAVDGDLDGDGFPDAALGGDDCDDADATVFPGAVESCNDVDDDCDGTVDDDAADASLWYADADGDGYGDGGATAACDPPADHAALDGDCDDGDPAVNPGAPEQCETGVDEDCDGEIDTDAAGSFAQWIDADGDTYGRGAAISDCVLHDGYALRTGDCDDTRADTNPGELEVCDTDDRDEDCDGDADDDDTSTTGQTRHYEDTDGDGHGDAASPGNRCDPGSGWSATADDCDDTEDLAWTGAAEVCDDGVDNDCSGGDERCAPSGSGSLGGAEVKLTGAGANGLLGDAVDGAGDRDGDGTPDVVLGAWGYGTGGTVYLVGGAGLSSGSVSVGTAVTAEAAGDGLGFAVAGCGNVVGGAGADVVFSAPSNGSGKGAVYLWSGSRGAGAASAADDVMDGAAGDALGAALDCGRDVDDDGKNDVIAGATGSGVAYVLDAGTLSAHARLTGGSGAGSSVALLADVDGDGVDDLLVGDEQANKAWLVLGSAALGNLTLSSGADAAYTGAATGDTAGAAVAGLGDADGDGYGDLLIGAPENDDGGSASGSAYVVRGRTTPSTTSLASADLELAGVDASDHAGAAVAGPGDVDADGYDDVLVGAYYDETAGTGAGAAYLLYGAAALGGTLTAADATFLGEDTRDSAGEALGGAGDLDGDGAADLVIGAPSEASAAAGAGAAYVVFGGPG